MNKAIALKKKSNGTNKYTIQKGVDLCVDPNNNTINPNNDDINPNNKYRVPFESGEPIEQSDKPMNQSGAHTGAPYIWINNTTTP